MWSIEKKQQKTTDVKRHFKIFLLAFGLVLATANMTSSVSIPVNHDVCSPSFTVYLGLQRTELFCDIFTYLFTLEFTFGYHYDVVCNFLNYSVVFLYLLQRILIDLINLSSLQIEKNVQSTIFTLKGFS